MATIHCLLVRKILMSKKVSRTYKFPNDTGIRQKKFFITYFAHTIKKKFTYLTTPLLKQS